MKKILRFLISRVFWFSLLIVVQIGIFAVILFNISSYSTYLYAAFVLFSLIIVIWLVAKDDNPSYKITWIILIMTLPVVGWYFYHKFGNKTLPHRYWEKIAANEAAHPTLFTAEEGATAALLEQYPGTASSPIISAISPAFRPMAAPRWNTPLWARISSAS